MNPNYTEFKFPQIKAHPWTKVNNTNMQVDNQMFQKNKGLTSVYSVEHIVPPSIRGEHVHLSVLLQVFKPRTPPEAITLCSRLLEYTPASRFSPFEACSHAFFDELRQPNTRLPNGRELPQLFNFSPTGSEMFVFEQFCDPTKAEITMLALCHHLLNVCFAFLFVDRAVDSAPTEFNPHPPSRSHLHHCFPW